MCVRVWMHKNHMVEVCVKQRYSSWCWRLPLLTGAGGRISVCGREEGSLLWLLNSNGNMDTWKDPNFLLTIEGRDSPLLNDPFDRMWTRSETVLYGVASCIQEVKKQVTDRGFTKCNETSQTWIPTSPRLTHSPRLPSDKRLHLVGSSSRLLTTNIYSIYTSLCILIVIWVRHKSWQ